MLIPLLMAGLLQQQSVDSPGSPDSGSTLLRPLAVICMPEPGRTVKDWSANPLIQELLQEDNLKALAEAGEEGASAGMPAAFAAWELFFRPLGGDVQLFVESLAGGGLRLMLLEGVHVDGVAGQPRWVLLAESWDAEIAMDCLGPGLQLAGVPRADLRGEDWTVPVANLHLRRQGDRFLLSDDLALLDSLATIPSSSWHPSPDGQAFPGFEDADLQAWMSGELLRADGYPALPEDAGASYLVGDMHEVLRRADWIGMRFGLQGPRLRLAFAAPADPEIRTTHAPFFPETQDFAMPKLERRMMEGVFTRDLAGWWTARSEFLSARGLAETIEGDSNLALLFGRDAGSEVFPYLEDRLRLIAAPLPTEEAADLRVEYPAGAIGLRFTEDAPEDLGQAFSNAFFAAITFANFDGGAMNEGGLQMDIHPLEGGRIYTGTYPALEPGSKAPARYNFSPALLLRDDGEVWISTSLGLLHEIAAAPVETLQVPGMWTRFSFAELEALAQRDRALLVANQMLEAGGDLERAELITGMILTILGRLDQGTAHAFLDGEDLYRLRFQLDFRD